MIFSSLSIFYIVRLLQSIEMKIKVILSLYISVQIYASKIKTKEDLFLRMNQL